MIRRIKTAFEILKAPFFRTSMPSSRGCKHGPNLWQEHHRKAVDAPRGAKKKKSCINLGQMAKRRNLQAVRTCA